MSSEITDIGVLHNGKGRPTLVFVHGTPTKEHLEEAKSRQVILKDSTTVNVVNINSKKQIVSIFDDAKTTKSVIEMSENKPVNV